MNWAALCAGLSIAAAAGLVVAGVYVLAGTGWALLAGACPLALFGGVVMRGLSAR